MGCWILDEQLNPAQIHQRIQPGWGTANQRHSHPWQVHAQCWQHKSQRRFLSFPLRTGSTLPRSLSSCLPSKRREVRHLELPCNALPAGWWPEQSWDTVRHPSTRAEGSQAIAVVPEGNRRWPIQASQKQTSSMMFRSSSNLILVFTASSSEEGRQGFSTLIADFAFPLLALATPLIIES